MGKWMRRLSGLYAALLVAAVLGGCGVREVFSSGKASEKEYGKPETMVIVTTERLRYEELYTDQIWGAAVDNRGTAFETVLIEQIHDFMKELKVMSLMAKDSDVSLTSRERELAKEAASKYYTALGGTDAASFGIDEKALEDLYTDYWLSEKLVDQLTEGVNLEVSDSEAKVITVQEIEVSDLQKAEEALAKASEEGADFTSVAKEYSESGEIRRQIGRGVRGSGYEEAAFGLAVGEISPVLEDNGKYYIVKCVSDYDETATRERKRQMIRQRKNEAFYGSYEAYKEGVTLVEDPTVWEGLTISGSPKVSADFFGIFDEVCREQS